MSSRLRVLILLATCHCCVVFGAEQALVADLRVISQSPFYHGWPTVAAKSDGELIVVYSGGRDYHVCPFGRVEMMTSKDGGTTWSWPRVVIDSATDDRDAGVLETAKGSLLAAFFTSLAYQGHLSDPSRLLNRSFGDQTEEHLARWRLAESRLSQAEKESDVGMWLVRSDDGGRTWSKRTPAPCNSPHGPTQLKDGRLLYVGKELWTEAKRVGAWESSDDGRTWSFLSELGTRPGETLLNYHEVYAVEAANGAIIVHIRNHNGKKREILQTESKDGGRTWAEPKVIGVSGYPSHILRMKNDALVMTYGYRKAPFGIRGKVSRDNGGTWSEELMVSTDAASWDVGYPSSVELPDGGLLTIWYEAPANSKRAVLRQARWTLTEQ